MLFMAKEIFEKNISQVKLTTPSTETVFTIVNVSENLPESWNSPSVGTEGKGLFVDIFHLLITSLSSYIDEINLPYSRSAHICLYFITWSATYDSGNLK